MLLHLSTLNNDKGINQIKSLTESILTKQNVPKTQIGSFEVRRRSSGFGRLTSQSCDEGRTDVPKLKYRNFTGRR